MANLVDVAERYERENTFPTSIALTIRRMRDAAPDLLPKTFKGGGKNSPQVTPFHLTNIILAQAAHLPINAADAVKSLRNLEKTDFEVLSGLNISNPMQGIRLDLRSITGTLGCYLDGFINGLNSTDIRESMNLVIRREFSLTLCADGNFACISQRFLNTVETVVFGNNVFSGHVQRLVILPYSVISIAGELWQDSCERMSIINEETKQCHKI